MLTIFAAMGGAVAARHAHFVRTENNVRRRHDFARKQHNPRTNALARKTVSFEENTVRAFDLDPD